VQTRVASAAQDSGKADVGLFDVAAAGAAC